MLERHKTDFKLADVILGGQDGLVNVLGVVLGVAAAGANSRLVMAAGLAATFAESVSMAAVAFTSKIAQADFYQSELEKERLEIKEVPEAEKEEVRRIYKKRGFEGELLETVVTKIVSNKKVWLEVMLKEELDLEEIDRKKILASSILVGFSAVLGSLIPLSTFALLPIDQAIYFSLLVSALSLMIVGAYKAKVTVGKPFKSGLQMAVIGVVSALSGYLIGFLFKVPAGF